MPPFAHHRSVEHISLLEAIARQEGFGKPGSRATRNHNPGNLNFGHFAREHGATGPDDKNYAVFPSNTAGFAALKALLSAKPYQGSTLKACLLRYCPPVGDPRGDNNTPQYIQNVASWMGISPDDIIDSHL